MQRRRGFSIVEIMLSILVVGILFVSGLMIFYQGVLVQNMAEDKARANSAARAAVEEVKQIKYSLIPLDSTGSGFLDAPATTKPNSYTVTGGQIRVVRTITSSVAGVKTVTVNVYRIDISGHAGVQQTATVTLTSDIYKYGM